jgi:predicted DNA-binding transcriptional regulator YafY
MNQALRVLRLLRELPRLRGGEASTAPALAELLQTSERTVYRDVELLGEAGFPVSNDGAGYYLPIAEQSLPVRLTASELTAIHYALQWLEEALPNALGESADALLGKLAAACGTSEAILCTGDDGLHIWPRAVDGPTTNRNLQIAMKARREHRKLRGVYCSLESGQANERTLHPYAVVYRAHAHYLVAYCELRREVRTFRLDRFTGLEVLLQHAEIDDEYDLESHFAGAWEVVGGRKQTVRLRIAGKVARRLAQACVHPSQQLLSRSGDMLEMQFKVALTEEFKAWILSLGGSVEVLAPRTLREEVLGQARQLLRNHEGS